MILALAAGSLSACERSVEVPRDVGTCWHMVLGEDNNPRFNSLARNVPNIETCAAELEGMRLRFNRLGQRNDEMIGGYQGRFIFLVPEGVFFGQTLTGARFPAMVRSGDGRLIVPGAMPMDTQTAAPPRPGETSASPAPK